VLTSVRRDDAGFYQCIVNNTVAMDAFAMATAYLHVTRTSTDRDVIGDAGHRARGRHRAGQLYVQSWMYCDPLCPLVSSHAAIGCNCRRAAALRAPAWAEVATICFF